MNVPLKYASLIKNAATTLPAAGTETIIPYESVLLDEGGWYDAGQPTRLTTPADINWVRLSHNVAFLTAYATNGGSVFTNFRKNGASLVSPQAVGDNYFSQVESVVTPIASQRMLLSGPILNAVLGDWFEARINVNNATLNTGLDSVRPGSTFTAIGYDTYSGVLLGLTATYTNSDFASIFTKILFDTAPVDTGGFADVPNSRIVVPAGVSKVRFHSSIQTNGGISVCGLKLDLRKDGIAEPDLGNGVVRGYAYQGGHNNSGFSNNHVQLRTPIINVSEGNYFELWLTGGGTGTVPTAIESNMSYFEMEIIQ